ncbi:MAG: nitrilase-related carbon-nitrogen hydrolase [Tissierellia bacterium]|nr:nitrilase-related carbon-nitrogen hydrolase [Tissierellia bacterium]
MKVGIVQNKIGDNLLKNIQRAKELGKILIDQGAEYIVFPELFQCPYEDSYIKDFANKDEGRTFDMLRELARSGVYVIGGTFPELRGKDIYNTSYVFNPKGEVIGHHDKNYLYTFKIPGKIDYDEGNIFTPGHGFSTFETEDGIFGLGICFDIRFPFPFEKMAMEGAKVIFLPGAFHHKVAKAHWELVLRARAVDNQVFMVGVSPAKGEGPSKNYYGHSLVVDPWANVISAFGFFEEIGIVNIDVNEVDQGRKELHIFKRKQADYKARS